MCQSLLRPLKTRRIPLRLSGCALGVALTFTCAALTSTAAKPHSSDSSKLFSVDRSMMYPATKIQNWFAQKDSWGPTYTGSPAWKKFTELIHAEIKSMAMVNVVDYSFPYTRWYTTEFPDKSGWSFISNGKPVEVASYGTQSGTTGPGGVTAPMILYDLTLPVDQRPGLSALAGKIVVVKQQPYVTFGTPERVPLGVPAPNAEWTYCGNPPACKPPVVVDGNPSPQWGTPVPLMAYEDYEYRSDSDTYPTALLEKTPVSVETSFRNRDQFGQIREVITNVLMASGAAAAVTVMDLSPQAAAGARIHPTPRRFNVPLLMLDKNTGAQVLADAAAGKTGKLVLDAHEEENATAYETIATLPGRNYGTQSDQAILLCTHIDGPSVIEDDGGLAILSVLHYYAQIPQAERPKSIIAFFDTRHFVPGTEASYPYDAVKDKPELFKTVVGGVAMEHFGGLQFEENGDKYAPSGKAATTYIWGWPNPLAIGEATKAIKDQQVPRAINDVPARPGVNGKPQQGWLGGGFSRYLVDLGGWPGWHISGDWPSGGFQAYYPAAKSRLSADLFVKQASAAVQLVNVLMVKDVITLAPAWGYLQVDVRMLEDIAFINPASATAGREKLTKDFDDIFYLVKAGDYKQVLKLLPAMSSEADKMLTGKPAETVRSAIQQASKMAERGAAWNDKTKGQKRN
jgi:hypothetical protein